MANKHEFSLELICKTVEATKMLEKYYDDEQLQRFDRSTLIRTVNSVNVM